MFIVYIGYFSLTEWEFDFINKWGKKFRQLIRENYKIGDVL